MFEQNFKIFREKIHVFLFQDSAAAWVKRQKKKLSEKAEAEKRAKVLAELDDEFGIGNIVSFIAQKNGH